MKAKIIAVLALGAIALLSGCAVIGPAAISPKVYKSSELKIVSADSLATAKNITSIQGQELDVKLAEQWGRLSEQEVKNAIEAITPREESGVKRTNNDVSEQLMDVVASIIGDEKKEEVTKKLKEAKKQLPKDEPSKIAPSPNDAKETPGVYSVGPDGVIGGYYCLFTNDSYYNKTLTLTKIGGILAGRSFRFDVPKNGGAKKYRLLPGEYAPSWTREYDSRVYYPDHGEKLVVSRNPMIWDDRTGMNYHASFRFFGYQ